MVSGSGSPAPPRLGLVEAEGVGAEHGIEVLVAETAQARRQVEPGAEGQVVSPKVWSRRSSMARGSPPADLANSPALLAGVAKGLRASMVTAVLGRVRAGHLPATWPRVRPQVVGQVGVPRSASGVSVTVTATSPEPSSAGVRSTVASA